MSFPFSFADIATVGRATPPTGGGGSYLFSDDLDYVDTATANATGKFVITPTVVFGYTPAISGIGVSSSLRPNSPAGAVATAAFAPQASVWSYVKFRTSNYTIALKLMSFRDASDANIGSIISLSSGALRLNALSGGSTTTAAGTIVNDTVYDIWLQYVTNGISSTLNCYLSTDGNRGTVLATKSGSESTTNAVSAVLGYGSSATTFLLNKWRVSATEIGDNPA